jgi:hypothetical protein
MTAKDLTSEAFQNEGVLIDAKLVYQTHSSLDLIQSEAKDIAKNNSSLFPAEFYSNSRYLEEWPLFISK